MFDTRGIRPAGATDAAATGPMSSRQRLEALAGLLDDFPADRWDLPPRERVELALTARSLVSRMQALAATLLAEADAQDATLRGGGTPTGTLLAVELNLSKAQAQSIVWDARRLGELPQARQAALQGAITMEHAKAVTKAMSQMPACFTPAQQAQAEARLVKIAAHATPEAVLREAPAVAAQVDPADAADREAARLTREREAALANRSLNWWREAGSLCFKGSLPQVEGAALTTLIDAYANQARHHQPDAKPPDETTIPQRRADALLAIAQTAQQGGTTPGIAGDRPTILVTLDLHKLQAGAPDPATLPDGHPLCHGDLRRLCCDANIIPAVLGADSEPLDVGRAARLVTPPIRKALHLRDRHCAFPNCDHPPNLCDAHHIRPWWDDGPTALNNLVLLCPTHHALVEPDRQTHRDQWTVTIDPDTKRPHFTKPTRYQQTTATGPPGPDR